MLKQYFELTDHYYRVRQKLAIEGWSNDSDDDVLDAIVELDSEIEHHTDEDLDEIIQGYRLFESMFPILVRSMDFHVK